MSILRRALLITALHSCLFTTGVLCVTLEQFYPFGSGAGDGFLVANDDDSSLRIKLRVQFPFFDENRRTVYVNNNGIISFGLPESAFNPQSFPLPTSASAISLIAPYWADVDTRGTGHVWFRETNDPELLSRARDDILRQDPLIFPEVNKFDPSSLLIATWDHVGYYDMNTDKTNTFQCVMATDGTLAFVVFLYAQGEIQWTTGDDSDGINGFGGTPAQVGFNAGDGIRFASVPDSQTANILHIDERVGNSGEIGVWIFRVDEATVEVGGDCSSNNGALHLSPSHGNMLGGTPVIVSGPCFNESQLILCQFGSATEEMHGTRLNLRQALCISPILQNTGNVWFSLRILEEQQVILESEEVPYHSVSFLTSFEVNLEEDTLLFDADSSITISWIPDAVFPLANSPNGYNIDVWLYGLFDAQWTPLACLASNASNTGRSTVTIPAMNQRFSDSLFPMTILVTPSTEIIIPNTHRRSTEELEVSTPAAGIWTGGAYFTAAPLTRKQCEEWASSTDRQFELGIIDTLPPCPCNVEQARAPSSGLSQQNLGHPFQTFFNENAATCFYASIVEFPPGFSARQCCYDASGNLIIGVGGGHADYFSPKSKGSFSANFAFQQHFEKDLQPFMQCCKTEFSICSAFYNLRPSTLSTDTARCQLRPTPPACLYGDPHLATLDGLRYTFNGKGEFILSETDDGYFMLQGRMVEATGDGAEPVAATSSSAIVAKQRDSDLVQFEVSRRGVDTLVDGERVDFGELRELHFNNVSVSSQGNDTYGASFSSGVYLQVQGSIGIISMLIVSLPNSFHGRTQGLMGNFNGDPSDDLLPRNETTPLPPDSTLLWIHEGFGLSWIISNPMDSLFTYKINEDWSDFFDPRFSAEFEPSFSDSVAEMQAQEICGGDEFCLFDIAVTGREELGIATRISGQILQHITALSAPTVCEPPCQNGPCVANNTCNCQAGYEGQRCEQAILQDECESNICQNGGSCRTLAGDYICLCPPSHTGLQCEQLVPLVLECTRQLREELLVIDCTANKPLSSISCLHNGSTVDACLLHQEIDLASLPAGLLTVEISVSDFFNLTENDTITYRKRFLELHFINSSPRTYTNAIFVDIRTNRPVTSLMCYLTGQQARNCSRGYAYYSGLQEGTYIVRVVAKASNGDCSVIRRRVYNVNSSTCSVHLINDGITIQGSNVTMEFLGNGPVLSYLCRLDTGSFQPCRSPYRLYQLGSGEHRFAVMPQGCGRRQRRIALMFSIN